MGHSSQNSGNWIRLVCILTAGLAVSVLSVAILRTSAAPASVLTILAIAVVVAAIIGRLEFSIAGVPIALDTGYAFAFWGVAWLGLGPGTILGAAVSTYWFLRERRFDLLRVQALSADIVAIFAAGTVYYLSLGDRAGYSGKALIPGVAHEANDTAAYLIMAAVNFSLVAALNLVSRMIVAGSDPVRLSYCHVLVPASVIAVSAAGALIGDLSFTQFGIEFGWVILPVAMLGRAAYTVHISRLASKTRVISETSRMHLATVEALATAIDARDQMGIGHVRRTQILAVGMGRMLGLSPSDLSALRTGALLHDIGKLAVPDHILNKPGRLTVAEIEKTKIHASVGASILDKVGFDTPVVPTVRYHHENWDGSGYPEALRGENIPLTARILSVADAYDTLRGARPYRPAISREETCEVLRIEAGHKFDPRLVKLFLENLDALEEEVRRQGLSYTNGFSEKLDTAALAVSAPPTGYVEQIKLANREANTLYELAREFGSSMDLNETLALLTEKIREFVPFNSCVVYMNEVGSNMARAVHVEGGFRSELLAARIRPGHGVTGRVVASGVIARNADPADEPHLAGNRIIHSLQSMISLPLITDEQMMGAVSLYSDKIAAYSAEHLRILETIINIASDAILKALRHAEAESNALTDPMTGLPNARSLNRQFEREAARALRTGTSFQLLMLDLDGFKQVNDRFGHKAGDRMLAEIGRVIRSQLREYDFLARYAGDEFVVIVPESTAVDVIDLCGRISSAVDDFELTIDGDKAKVGISIGFAGFPNDGSSFDQVLMSADKAMYAVKASRKIGALSGEHVPDADIAPSVQRIFDVEATPLAKL